MSELLVRGRRDGGGPIVEVTPDSAGWDHVGFEAVWLETGARKRRPASARETCVVVIEGEIDVSSRHGEWRGVGERETPFAGAPAAAYLPPRTEYELIAGATGAEVGICTGPAGSGAAPRVLPPDEVSMEIRGRDTHERVVHAILMENEAAESLLVCEVITPPGHWSSYPPHKHDRDALPAESLLEETYYHRLEPARGFGLQRVYTDDRSLDEAVTFSDRDTVLVPRGYHTVSMPPGYTGYYLNVMAGPVRAWAVVDDPDHAWARDGLGAR